MGRERKGEYKRGKSSFREEVTGSRTFPQRYFNLSPFLKVEDLNLLTSFTINITLTTNFKSLTTLPLANI